MRIPFLFLSAIGLMLIASGCTKATPEYHTYATVKDLMDSVVDPSADFIWDSVSTTSNLKGIVEKAPKTDEEWREVRRHAIALMEATDLLQMPGRTVARPGEKAADPRIELDPAVIQTMIDADRASWADHTRALYDATALIIKAVEAKSSDAILQAHRRRIEKADLKKRSGVLEACDAVIASVPILPDERVGAGAVA